MGLRIAVQDVEGPRYLQVRCQRRDCRYCGWLRDLEDATCLFLDARERQPELAITLTTHQPWEELDPAAYRDASAQLWRALRARWGDVQYVGLIEFTTGRAERSGGRRRMHGHYLVKGIPGDQVLDVERVVREVWERCTGAYVVEVSELRSAGGAIAYMGLHHRKPEQSAPAGWRGMRLRASKGYWCEPIAQLRERAKRHLAVRTRTRKWVLEGVDAELAAAMADLEVDAQRAAVAKYGGELVKVREPVVYGGVVVPLGPLDARIDPPEADLERWDDQPPASATDGRMNRQAGAPARRSPRGPAPDHAPGRRDGRLPPPAPVRSRRDLPAAVSAAPAASHPKGRAKPGGEALTGEDAELAVPSG